MSRFKRERPEKDIEGACRKIAERLGGKLIKLQSPGNPGVPDRLLLLPKKTLKYGVAAVIEFKRPGKDLTELQAHWLGRFIEGGIVSRRCDNVETFKTLLRDWGYDV